MLLMVYFTNLGDLVAARIYRGQIRGKTRNLFAIFCLTCLKSLW